MSDLLCAVCNEPWDSYGVSHGDMQPWEADLFRKGAGCPCCEGETPEGMNAETAQLRAMERLTFDGPDDPHAFPGMDPAQADLTVRPAWEKPEDPIVWTCAFCNHAVRKALGDNVNIAGELYSDHPLNTGRCSMSGESKWAELDEAPYKIRNEPACAHCVQMCDDCGENPIFTEPWKHCGDTYDVGNSFSDPRNFRNSICVNCFEAIPTCANCGEVCDADEFDDNGFADCCKSGEEETDDE